MRSFTDQVPAISVLPPCTLKCAPKHISQEAAQSSTGVESSVEVKDQWSYASAIAYNFTFYQEQIYLDMMVVTWVFTPCNVFGLSHRCRKNVIWFRSKYWPWINSLTWRQRQYLLPKRRETPSALSGVTAKTTTLIWIKPLWTPRNF